ncbi:ABC transporter substrate-binding protein [Trebonia kvetii]|uniref:ABC transporter substrate-binding protein n=2 Tax=Trebonia kvetii TaxID=2480626 RepID=A0A6P2C0K6_9ACTN|nr:ABC transporter substrate-binding protein [Trebonia kvetii]
MFRSRMRILAPPLAIALLALSGCGGLSANAGSTSPNGLQKTTLNVAVVPAVDSAGFFVALYEGLFARQGLTIHYTPAVSSEEVISQQLTGKYDITGGNYVSFIQHYVTDHQPLEIVAEGSVMQQGTQAIYTMPGSKIKTLKELKGHLLGINAPLNINYLLAASVLTENGIRLNQVRFPTAPIPFPTMAAALAAGKIDAAAMPEPFASAAEQQYGAVPLADLNQGATQNFPIQGYVATKSWVQQNPGTLRAFLAALSQGQEIADTSRGAVERAMEALKGPMNGQIPPIVAAVMAVNIYPTSIDQVRIQRVADVMYQFGLLHSRFNVTPMIGP